MTYIDFLENLGCPDNQQNENIYLQLTSLLNDREVIEIGKMLVNYNLPKAFIKYLETLKHTIQDLKEQRSICVGERENAKYNLSISKTREEKEYYQDRIQSKIDKIEELTQEINQLENLLKS